MSIYSDLGISPRATSWCTMQQFPSSVNPDEYRTWLQESLEQIRSESALIRQTFDTVLGDTRMKFSQVARGSLNQFLSTPIKSDTEDVQRIIKDALEKYTEQILPTHSLGIKASWSSQIVTDTALVAGHSKISSLIRSMLSSGKRKLREEGFKVGRTASNIFETVYVVEGGTNLEALESILTKRLSSQPFPHPVESSRDGLYSVVSLVGDADPQRSLWDTSLDPAFEAGTAPDFNPELEKSFETLAKEFNIHQISLWEKRLSYSQMGRFALRMRTIPDQRLISEIIKWLGQSGSEALKRSLTPRSSLIVKEIVA